MLVDRPGEDLVSFPLLDWHRLAGDGGLIDGRRSLDHPTVQRDFCPGFNNKDVAEPNLFNRQHLLLSVATDKRLGWRHVHQRPDRVACPVHGSGFEYLCQGKEESDGGCLDPLADEHGPEHGNCHKEVHIEVQLPSSEEPSAGNVVASRYHGRQVHWDRCPRRMSEKRKEKAKRGEAARSRGENDYSVADPDGGKALLRCPYPGGPSRHPGFTNGCDEFVARGQGGVVLDPKTPADDVGGKSFDPRQRRELFLQNCHLVPAVHLLDFEDRNQGTGDFTELVTQRLDAMADSGEAWSPIRALHHELSRAKVDSSRLDAGNACHGVLDLHGAIAAVYSFDF